MNKLLSQLDNDKNMNQYSGKKIIVTGHTGFKGSWLALWLMKIGAKVTGISYDVPTKPSHFDACNLNSHIEDHRVDIRSYEQIKKIIKKVQPDFVFHLAAQAIVRTSYDAPVDTMMTNSIGTANILEAIRTIDKPVVAVLITSDKAYDNVEWTWGYRENDRLGGKDPYSASKGMAELVIKSFVESYFSSPTNNVLIGIARAGNVIGGGDWAADRIVPDCMRSWANKKVVEVRSPNATRPWQHVLEPLSGYLSLGIELSNKNDYHGEAFNFGPPASQNYSVRELIDEMACHWESVKWNDVSNLQYHVPEAALLKLNCDKALFNLKWYPTLDFKETVGMTVEWYKRYYQDAPDSIYDLSISQIEQYCNLASKRKLSWSKE